MEEESFYILEIYRKDFFSPCIAELGFFFFFFIFFILWIFQLSVFFRYNFFKQSLFQN